MNASKNKFYAYIFLAILMVSAFVYFIMGYFAKEVEETSAKIVEAKRSAYSLSSKNKQLESSKKEYQDIEDKTKEAFASIIDDDKIVDFISLAEKTAQDDKVKMKIRTVGGDKNTASDNNSFITTTGLNFTVGGSFDGVMHFLYDLENFQYDVDISNVSVKRGDFDQYNKGMIMLSFDLKLYQKDNKK